MLNNHSIFIRKEYNLVFLLLILLTLSSCASVKKKSKRKKLVKNTERCEMKKSSSDQRFLTLSAKHHARILQRCFKNYLRFEKNKKQTIYTCNTLTVRKNGKVTYAYTRGMNGTVLPKDIKMCMEQDFWKMHFKGLQLNRGYTIKFPLGFKSI